jgi:glycosyltransferase involved in cell wall biosynthesis
VLPVAWTPDWGGLRRLSDGESRRVLCWGTEPRPSGDRALEETGLIVPWRTVVVLAECPSPPACERLAALAEHSGNTIVAIGYDCIPVVSADMVPDWEPPRFARYLNVVKHSRRVAAISESAREEFRGFADALPSQGLPGPEVVECPLPANSPVRPDAGAGPEPPTGQDHRRALILSVGSFEPRKNQLAVLYAAETLWREGLDFDLLLIGGSGWGDDLDLMVAKLQETGRPVETARRVSSAQLVRAYRRARFTVFPSLHEGYGLPVAESLSMGTPAITGNYGSTREIGALGGALLIDPRDDEAIISAMRTLLTDEDALQALRDAIELRPARDWEDYAAELWACLVQPELPGNRCD